MKQKLINKIKLSKLSFMILSLTGAIAAATPLIVSCSNGSTGTTPQVENPTKPITYKYNTIEDINQIKNITYLNWDEILFQINPKLIPGENTLEDIMETIYDNNWLTIKEVKTPNKFIKQNVTIWPEDTVFADGILGFWPPSNILTSVTKISCEFISNNPNWRHMLQWNFKQAPNIETIIVPKDIEMIKAYAGDNMFIYDTYKKKEYWTIESFLDLPYGSLNENSFVIGDKYMQMNLTKRI